MKHFFPFIFSLLFLLPLVVFAQPIHHQIKAKIYPDHRQIEIEDTITLPKYSEDSKGKTLQFILHAGLNPSTTSPGVTIQREKQTSPANKTQAAHPDLPVERYSLTLPEGVEHFILTYGGKITHPLKEEGESYGRRSRETPGLISKEGVFLAGASFWYPVFDEALLTFHLDITMPAGWDAVSQGARWHHIRDKEKTVVHWESKKAQEEIYLVAGKWTEYSRTENKIETMVFLRSPDQVLADKYLEATAHYLQMYQKLLGPYPYSKFALVENFWETGYGMPSFTLLGPKIIRMPFILHSSYPHEILHNWWGNGVYVDSKKGNWAEGLTTYLADHLIAEQRGMGSKSRRATLQKYADYVSSGKDFALSSFLGRESAATEAVGYGKTLMFFHMLRMQLGDDNFIAALRNFYDKHQFQRANFSDLKAAFSEMTEEDLTAQFDQWVTRSGAPKLKIKKARVQKISEEFRLIVTLQQTQAGSPYRLEIPIAISLAGEEQAKQFSVLMDTKELTFSVIFKSRPLKLDIDPEFDLFRRLDRAEIPPALSLAFGAERVLILLPENEKGELRGAYDELARAWQGAHAGKVEIKWDFELNALPADRAVWLLGWKNSLLKYMKDAVRDNGVVIQSQALRIKGEKISKKGHSVVLSTRNPKNPELALSWLASDSPAALPGLTRKLPHYGRYSYLAFEGQAPSNILKGIWPLNHSPLSLKLGKGAEKKNHFAPRTPLENPANHGHSE